MRSSEGCLDPVTLKFKMSMPVLIGNEDLIFRELLKKVGRFAQVRGEHVQWISGDPLREVDRLINSGIESDQ